MHPNEALLHRFYERFNALDGATMASLYTDDAEFSDPVFPLLKQGEPGRMWRMLTANAKGFSLEVSGISADDRTGKAHWEARYTFSRTGRQVHNIIDATFEFRGGKIYRHTDSFDFWRWTRMALGPVGWLLGWSGLVQNKVRAQARAGLDAFQ